MTLTTSRLVLTRSAGRPWEDPSSWWPALTAATDQLDPPYGVVAWDALSHNAFDLLDRAAGKPIRVATKSVRVRGVLDAVLALPGYAGLLAYTLPEALWLAQTHPDVVVGYPTAHRAAIAHLVSDDALAARVTLMVDDPAQLDLVDAVAAPTRRAEVRVCLELDASYRSRHLGHVGVRRSPVHDVREARDLAELVVGRAGFRLVGMMAYEAQVAGVTNAGRGRAAIRAMQRASVRELGDRRGAAVAAVRGVADLEFVNGGGTGSVESTRDDPSVTEIAAGSGLFGPHLFDHYVQFTPAPAACFALPVVRRPSADTVTLLGGGWVASGPPNPDRVPLVVWPEGLRMLPREMAGEVQTPLTGAAARDLAVGDRVWLRHTKAGELSEHLFGLSVVSGESVVAELATYRGEGKAFL